VVTTSPVFPPGRYGRRRDPARQRRRKLVTFTLAVVVGLVGVVIAFKLFNQYSQPAYQVSDLATTAVTDTSITVSFSVNLPAGSGAACTVVANTRDGARVGTAEIAVPPAAAGETSTRVTYTLPTSQRAFAGTVPGCGPPR
jgi:hypothetical protein